MSKDNQNTAPNRLDKLAYLREVDIFQDLTSEEV